jgi:hypothetical protein
MGTTNDTGDIINVSDIITNTSNSSNSTHIDHDDEKNIPELYFHLIIAGGVLVGFWLCSYCCYLDSIDYDCKKVYKDFKCKVKDCYKIYFCCFTPICDKIKNVSICIHDIWCDFWCPLEEEDPNYFYTNNNLYGSMDDLNQIIHCKEVNFEEKDLSIKPDEEYTCSICLEVINNNKLVATSCNHYYCRDCIQDYLNIDSNGTCPLCRRSIGDTLYVESPA